MNLISWNTNGRVALQTQVDQMLAHDPDTLCLQEVLASQVPTWRDTLKGAGFSSQFIVETGRKKGVAIASRLPMGVCETPALPRSDAIIGAVLGGVPVWSIHIPNGNQNKRTKIDCIELICKAAMATTGPMVIAGDFNGPQIEYKDGTIVTWGQTEKGNLRARHGTVRGYWDQIERMAFEGLPEFGLRDIWHDLNPSLIGESPTWRRFRLDHVFSNLPAISATHEDGLSDHKMIVVELQKATSVVK